MDKDSTPFLLPTDALLVVFQHLFAPDSDACSSGLPLSVFIERWTAVRATCSHWQEVIDAPCAWDGRLMRWVIRPLPPPKCRRPIASAVVKL